MAAADRESRPVRWPLSLALLLALGAALASLGVVFSDGSWWMPAMAVAVLATVAMGLVRASTRYAALPTVAGILAVLVLLTFSFAPGAAYLLVIPNVEVFAVFNHLIGQAVDSITDQAIPADPTQGIVFLVVLGAGLLAVLLDLVAVALRRPALAGVPLLAILVVPSLFDPSLGDAFSFFLTAITYLLVLYVGLGERRGGGAISVAAGAMGIALVLPLLLPTPGAGPNDSGTGGGSFAIGVNAFITLGDDLRQSKVRELLRYRTSNSDSEYITLSVIRDLQGDTWGPAAPSHRSDATIDSIGVVPGLTTPGITTESVTTSISVTNMGGHWLPAPYAPRTVSGADKNWSYDAESLTIDSPTESARGEVYTVKSERPTPTIEQLRASPTQLEPGLDDYLRLPSDLPVSVWATAIQVGVGDTTFDRALALQDYFTSGDFEYSETAPVSDNYDGASAGIVGAFLEKKKGYCVHFSSAMAVMARTLGIPSRIVVGFAPAEFTAGKDGEDGYYSVTTQDLHAWPELWFAGIGWVRFEPTPGRGKLPHFASSADPSKPDATPTATATGGPLETLDPTSTGTFTALPTSKPGTDAVGPVNATLARATVTILIGAAVVVLLLPLWPMVVRITRRVRRYTRVRRRGSAREAWAELNDTAVDLGWDVSTMTPRDFAALVRSRVNEGSVAALDRLQLAIETEAYSQDGARSVLADLGRVRRAMWKATDRRAHLQAIFSPSSAIRRR